MSVRRNDLMTNKKKYVFSTGLRKTFISSLFMFNINIGSLLLLIDYSSVNSIFRHNVKILVLISHAK